MNKLIDEWLEIDKLVLYGWGNIGKKCVAKLEKDFTIISIIDNDSNKHGNFHGIPITSEVSSWEIIKSNKVVVLTGGKIYKDIASRLTKAGLKEYYDFCSVEEFISEWYWEKKEENCLLEVHTAITMKCTFNCKNCNMFVPYYREKIDYSFSELKEMYDLFFQYVDYVFCISILGGEPFLNPYIGEIIDYLGEKYFNKIGVINVISNGSIMPNDQLLEVFVRNNVLVYLSDYSSIIPYKSKILHVVEKFQSRGINCVLRTADQWKDFGFPVMAPIIENVDTSEHMKSCAPIFHGLNDNKFYYCHVAWSAEKAGLYTLNEQDYIDLENLQYADRRKISQHALGNIDNQYISLCKLCGGCGEDNPNIIHAAIQME